MNKHLNTNNTPFKKAVMLFCCSAILLNVAACSRNNAVKTAAQTNAKTVLTDAAEVYANVQSVTAKYTHFYSNTDDLTQTYKTEIQSHRVSGITRLDGHEDLKDGDKTVIYNPVSEYFYDTDSGIRYIYVEDALGWQSYTFPVYDTAINEMNAAALLLQDLNDGFTALSAERSADRITVTGSSRSPRLLSFEGRFIDEDLFDWSVTAIFDATTKLPKKVTYEKDEERVIVEYDTFNDHLDISLPDAIDETAPVEESAE